MSAVQPRLRQWYAMSNYVCAAGAALLTVMGAFLFFAGGPGLGIPGGLLAIAAAPVAVAFCLAALAWHRRWRHACVVQLLPFLVVLGWVALILLSPMQHHPPSG